MTLHSQHLAFLPEVRRYQHRVCVLKEHQELVDQIKNSEVEWRETRGASFNRNLFAVIQEQVIVLYFSYVFFCSSALTLLSVLHFNSGK